MVYFQTTKLFSDYFSSFLFCRVFFLLSGQDGNSLSGSLGFTCGVSEVVGLLGWGCLAK